ncbi:MBL fold metallo-hydrolase [Crocinitomicaceae bacterium]|nr:MBL fold metallo-hydrolase [Crocinitomicaceae bacterium]
MRFILYVGVAIGLFACSSEEQTKNHTSSNLEKLENTTDQTTLVVLGNVQDAGSPQIGCEKECCTPLFKTHDHKRKVVSLGLLDPSTEKKYLFEATPDINSQVEYLSNLNFDNGKNLPDGIFITHAHIGHYTGLMYLGKEAINASKIPVYTFPRMANFLRNSGPWSQLVRNENIELNPIDKESAVVLSDKISVEASLVTHRDEYSETAGFKINGPNKTALFIPDIDKWKKWDKDIIQEIRNTDYAFIDATFFDGSEIDNRDMSEIPHPFIVESMKLFEHLSVSEKNKIYFIHLNHTNPALRKNSPASQLIIRKGFNVARFGQTFVL